MSKLTIILLIVLVIMIILMIVLYFLGKKAQKKQEEQNEVIARTAQSVSMLIIDKKKVRMDKSGLPQEVIDQTPFYLKRSKVPVVKAKVGPRMAVLMCAPEVFDDIPVKKEVKASVSGMYISGVRGLHGRIEPTNKKKSLMARIRARANGK